jgi:hypothetical protein
MTDAVEKVGGELRCLLDLASVGLTGVSGLALVSGSASTLMPPIHATQLTRGWRLDEAQSQRLEVLHDRSEVELISGAGQALSRMRSKP